MKHEKDGRKCCRSLAAGKGGEAATKWSSALICAFSPVEKSVINQQRTIDFPAQSSQEAVYQLLLLTTGVLGRYPAAAMALALVIRSLKDGRSQTLQSDGWRTLRRFFSASLSDSSMSLFQGPIHGRIF